jgi:hypothetical protein
METASDSKISLVDIPFLYFLIRNACDDLGVPVSNITVSKKGCGGDIELDNESFIHNQALIIKNAIRISANSAGRTVDESVISGIISSLIGIMQMTYGMYGGKQGQEKVAIRLDQLPGSFIIANNIACPICELKLINYDIMLDHTLFSPFCIKSNTVVINSQISNMGAYDCIALACLCIKNGKNPKDIFSQMLSSRMFKRILTSSLNNIYNDSEVDINAFLLMAHAFADMPRGSIDWNQQEIGKQASFTAPSFWIFGLIEKMLAPVRGVRDNIAEKWAPISHEVWDRIDERRKVMGLPHAPMELMLRVQSEPFSQNGEDKLLQSRLEESRLWKIKKIQ